MRTTVLVVVADLQETARGRLYHDGPTDETVLTWGTDARKRGLHLSGLVTGTRAWLESTDRERPIDRYCR